MTVDNPYPFEAEAFAHAKASLFYHIDEAWIAGASEAQIVSTIQERLNELDADGSIVPGTDYAADAPSGVAEEAEVEPTEEPEETPSTDSVEAPTS